MLVKSSLLAILFVFLLQSCANHTTEDPKEEITVFENDTLPAREKLKEALLTDYVEQLGLTETAVEWLRSYYATRNYQPRWITDSTYTDEGKSLQETLHHSIRFGIPFNRLTKGSGEKAYFFENEFVLSLKLAGIVNDLNHGFVDLEAKKYKPHAYLSGNSLDSLLLQCDTLTFDQILLKQGPADSNYRFLSNQIYTYSKMHPIDSLHFHVPSIKTDTLKAFAEARKSLIAKHFITNENIDSLGFTIALKQFQKENGLRADGVIGKYTCKALNESTYDKLLRASLTLDKIRQQKSYPEKCIRINIPEYVLRLIVKDSLKEIHKIVVGKPENQTPELISKVRDIMVYPYWNVPASIAGKEILPAVRNNPAYLSRNHYKIYRGDKEIDPYSVNWKKVKDNTFPYKVVQQPGKHNSLGIIKFEFSNNYSVYVHDTPSKSLFNTDIRAYSHGCMRCQDPIQLGRTILAYDSVGRKRNDLTADSLDSLVNLAENYRINLRSYIPIYIEYQTVYADREKLIFYTDIYMRDEEYLKFMRN